MGLLSDFWSAAKWVEIGGWCGIFASLGVLSCVIYAVVFLIVFLEQQTVTIHFPDNHLEFL